MRRIGISTACFMASALACLLTVLPAIANQIPAVVRGPYLQSATADSVVVRWATLAEASSWLAYGPAPDRLDTVIVSTQLVREHELQISDLQPGQEIYYAVGTTTQVLAGGDERFVFRTVPPSGPTVGTRIWALGDSGTANHNSAAVRDSYRLVAGKKAPDVWLMLGDNAYFYGTWMEYRDAVFHTYPGFLRATVLWPSIGNHDALSSDSTTQSGPYFSLFTLPDQGQAGGVASNTEAYYAFDHGAIHFVCLDSADSEMSAESTMLQWLEDDLEASDSPWTIAFFHHPPYSKGSHDSDNPVDSAGLMFDVREQVLPILEAHGVDLVLTGHSHNYERSFLLDRHYGTSDTLDPASMVLDGGDGRLESDGPYRKVAGAHGGTVYVVAGTSGSVGPGTLDHPAMYIGLGVLGSVIVDVGGDRLDARFINTAGETLDFFTMLKSTTLFADGFDSGSTSAWTLTVP